MSCLERLAKVTYTVVTTVSRPPGVVRLPLNGVSIDGHGKESSAVVYSHQDTVASNIDRSRLIRRDEAIRGDEFVRIVRLVGALQRVSDSLEGDVALREGRLTVLSSLYPGAGCAPFLVPVFISRDQGLMIRIRGSSQHMTVDSYEGGSPPGRHVASRQSASSRKGCPNR